MILENRRIILELLGPIHAFWYWPYDQGGCGCPSCADENGWGKTFLKIGPHVSRIVKGLNPQARFIVSTWYMNDAEMQLVYEEARRSERWFDGLLIETRRAGEPKLNAGLSISVFPEISMFDCYFFSYGSNGANPAPRRFAEQAKRTAACGYGAVVYSEGVYEDLNKIVWASLLWNPDRTPEDIVEEYARHYFGRENAQAGTNLLFGLEDTWGSTKLANSDAECVTSLRRLAESMENSMPASASSSWRWRALLYRARLDDAMKQIGSCQDIVKDIKHLADDAAYADDLSDLRSKLASLCARLEMRLNRTDDLFELYWQYLDEFHLDSTTLLIFRPDELIGTVNFRALFETCKEALQQTENTSMRRHLIKAIHHWFWFNNINTEFLYI